VDIQLASPLTHFYAASDAKMQQFATTFAHPLKNAVRNFLTLTLDRPLASLRGNRQRHICVRLVIVMMQLTIFFFFPRITHHYVQWKQIQISLIHIGVKIARFDATQICILIDF
jgi:hypothetical protein